jgi:Spy/CpxP family protein refolding chaperone
MKTFLTLAFNCVLALGITGVAMAQDNTLRPQTAREELQRIHGPQSIDQELDRLTKDLELTPKQRKQIRPLLEEHHDKIQALLDKNPTLSRQALGPQIHAISDKTHHQINALLTGHQMELVKAMQKRMHDGEESRRPAPSK